MPCVTVHYAQMCLLFGNSMSKQFITDDDEKKHIMMFVVAQELAYVCEKYSISTTPGRD